MSKKFVILEPVLEYTLPPIVENPTYSLKVTHSLG